MRVAGESILAHLAAAALLPACLRYWSLAVSAKVPIEEAGSNVCVRSVSSATADEIVPFFPFKFEMS